MVVHISASDTVCASWGMKSPFTLWWFGPNLCVGLCLCWWFESQWLVIRQFLLPPCNFFFFRIIADYQNQIVKVWTALQNNKHGQFFVHFLNFWVITSGIVSKACILLQYRPFTTVPNHSVWTLFDLEGPLVIPQRDNHINTWCRLLFCGCGFSAQIIFFLDTYLFVIKTAKRLRKMLYIESSSGALHLAIHTPPKFIMSSTGCPQAS